MNQNILVQQNIPLQPVEIKVSGNIVVDKTQSISGNLSIGAIHSTKYTGDYIVIPKVTEQTLETAHKLMTDDVTIKEIPFSKVSNIFNGYTVNIGG